MSSAIVKQYSKAKNNLWVASIWWELFVFWECCFLCKELRPLWRVTSIGKSYVSWEELRPLRRVTSVEKSYVRWEKLRPLGRVTSVGKCYVRWEELRPLGRVMSVGLCGFGILLEYSNGRLTLEINTYSSWFFSRRLYIFYLLILKK